MTRDKIAKDDLSPSVAGKYYGQAAVVFLFCSFNLSSCKEVAVSKVHHSSLTWMRHEVLVQLRNRDNCDFKGAVLRLSNE